MKTDGKIITTYLNGLYLLFAFSQEKRKLIML